MLVLMLQLQGEAGMPCMHAADLGGMYACAQLLPPSAQRVSVVCTRPLGVCSVRVASEHEWSDTESVCCSNMLQRGGMPHQQLGGQQLVPTELWPPGRGQHKAWCMWGWLHGNVTCVGVMLKLMHATVSMSVSPMRAITGAAGRPPAWPNKRVCTPADGSY